VAAGSGIDGFDYSEVTVGPTRYRPGIAGDGPPVLLLHGFPQTGYCWHRVAPALRDGNTVVVCDLKGYGDSPSEPGGPLGEGYGKRTMAAELAELMGRLGFERFAVAGHDRGGRVAYRMALDHPRRVDRLAVLDILPTETVWEGADARFALAYWPWSLLAQPAPLPERLLAAAPEAVVDDALGGWGSAPAAFGPEIREAYIEALRDPAHVHAICEEYRAASTLDRAQEDADRAGGRRVACPALALWSGRGPLGSWYAEAGGPLGLWRAWADDVRGHAFDAGHFFPEELPEETADALGRFFAAAS
jgi:haloacetate dehalogenase